MTTARRSQIDGFCISNCRKNLKFILKLALLNTILNTQKAKEQNKDTSIELESNKPKYSNNPMPMTT